MATLNAEKYIDDIFISNLQLWRDPNLNTRPVVQIKLAEFEMYFIVITGVRLRFDDEFFAGLPLSFNCRFESAL